MHRFTNMERQEFLFPSSAGGRLQQSRELSNAVKESELERDPSSKTMRHKRSITHGGLRWAVSKAASGLLGIHGHELPDTDNNGKASTGLMKSDASLAATSQNEAASVDMGVRVAYKKPANKFEGTEVIYEKDIEMSIPATSSTSGVVVQAHRKQVRVKKRKDMHMTQQNADRKKSHAQRRVRFGRPLVETPDNDEYLLTMGMMVGLRVAVGRQENPLAKQELTVSDFYQVDNYVFPPSGALGIMVTPPHKLGHTFKFKDYAPKVFKRIRGHFGVDRMRYMLSVAGNYNFLDFITNAKSGEFFFFSHDENFMIKTMKKAETRFLRRILPHYYEHVRKHPDTMLVRFCGMYRVKMHHINRKVHFMVMSSVFDTHKEMHTIYDLKGSTVGRSKKEGESVGKDLDLVKCGNKIHLGRQRDAFLKVISDDVAFLAKLNIMDYSLLLGVHDRSRPTDASTSCRPHYTKFLNYVDESGTEGSQAGEGNIGLVSASTRRKHWEMGDLEETKGEGTGPPMDFERGDYEFDSDSSPDSTTSPYFNRNGCINNTFVEQSESDEIYFIDGQDRNFEEDTVPNKICSGPIRESRSEGMTSLLTSNECSVLNHEITPVSCISLPTHYERQSMQQEITIQIENKGLIRRRLDLGINSEMSGSGRPGRGREIYFMGIIDVLQEYNLRKHAETTLKATFLRQSKSKISCIDPEHYAERFLEFLREQTD